MFDLELRPVAEQVLEPLARPLAGIRPEVITFLGGSVGLVAALTAAAGWWPVAAGAWLANRLLDGIDGVVARSSNVASDAGGYLDITVDVAVYALIPIGVAAGLATKAAWVATAVLLASFYFNTITWTYLSALIEKRKTESSPPSRPAASTSVIMPRSLVEGAETTVLFTVLLLAPLVGPSWPIGVLWAMAALVTVGAVARFLGGWKELR